MIDTDDTTTTESAGSRSPRVLTNAVTGRLPWVTSCAWLTVAAVCPLVFLGALVTTMKAGMVDERAFVSPHQSIPELWQGGRGLGFGIEHSHRLAGWFAGLCGIQLAIVCWFTQSGGSRWLGLVALGLISFQGVLGYFRVALNSWWGPNLAWIHGCFAQVVFAVLVGLAVLLSRTRNRFRGTGFLARPSSAPGRQYDDADARRLDGLGSPSHENDLTPRVAPATTDRVHRWALVCVALVLCQLILGGVIRHESSLIVARVHLIGSFVVVIALVRLARLALREKEVYHGWSWLLMGLLTLQVLLGVEAGVNWMARYFNPTFDESFGLMLMRTSHYFIGSLLFAVTAVLALRPLPATGWQPALREAGELHSLQGGAA